MKLVIDGNSLLNVVASSALYKTKDKGGDLARPFFRVHDKLVIKDDSSEYFNAQLYKYISSIVNGLTYVDEVFFAIDSLSWRKLYVEKYFEVISSRVDFDKDKKNGYKGNRKKDGEFKEQLIALVKYLSNETLLNLCKNVQGSHIISVKGLEGDDIVYSLVNKLKVNNDVIIWSNDSDLHQLIEDNVYVIGSNDIKTKQRKLFRAEKSNTVTPSMDFDFNMTNIDQVFSNLIAKCKYIETLVDPIYEVFTKILCGDKGSDNIPCIFSVKKIKTEKDGTTTESIVNVTQKKYSDKIFTYLLEEKNYTKYDIISKIDLFDEQLFKDIAFKTCELFDIELEENYRDVIRNLKFNIRLIRLSDSCIPKELLVYLDSLIIFNDENHRFNVSNFNNYISTKKYMNYDKT